MIPSLAQLLSAPSVALVLAEVPRINKEDVASLNIPQITLLILLVTLVMWPLGAWIERRNNRPVLEQERAFRLQAESKWQSEVQRAGEEKELLTGQLAAATQRCDELNARLDALTAEATELKPQLTEAQTAAITAQKKQSEVETQLEAANGKVTTLEAALEAEKSRSNAMQDALDAKQDLAKQLSQELSSTRATFADERAAAVAREEELRSQLATHEKTASSGQSMIDVVNTELEKTRTAQADLEKEYGTKLSDLQRKLSAADQKSAMLQKEIMALVGSGEGGAAGAAELVTHAEELASALERAKAAEKKAAELESQLAQGDIGTRKRLREAEYKICELEFKLAQTEEKS